MLPDVTGRSRAGRGAIFTCRGQVEIFNPHPAGTWEVGDVALALGNAAKGAAEPRTGLKASAAPMRDRRFATPQLLRQLCRCHAVRREIVVDRHCARPRAFLPKRPSGGFCLGAVQVILAPREVAPDLGRRR
jgi:hypothetical protein